MVLAKLSPRKLPGAALIAAGIHGALYVAVILAIGTGLFAKSEGPMIDAELARFPGFERARNIVYVDVDRIADSCGWGVPFYDFKGERDQLKRAIDHRSRDEWAARRYVSNAESIDGLTGLVRQS